jgi:filamentous hemagglutinin
VTITVPAPGGGVVLGTPAAPDLGTGQTDRGMFPFHVPDGSRLLSTDGADGPAEPSGTGAPDGPPTVHEGQQGKHVPGHQNFDPTRSTLTADPNELIGRAGSGEQVGAVPVGQAGSKERIDFGEEIGLYRDKDGNTAPTTVGLVHYSRNGAHIVPARPR